MAAPVRLIPTLTSRQRSNLMRKIRRVDGHWMWTGALDPRGYGVFGVGAQAFRAHRVVYTEFLGQIPDGLPLDHLCRVPACVNPVHLEPVTISVNTQRGLLPSVLRKRNAAKRDKTHCMRGHEFTEENTIRRPGNIRSCKICQNARERRSYLKRKHEI